MSSKLATSQVVSNKPSSFRWYSALHSYIVANFVYNKGCFFRKSGGPIPSLSDTDPEHFNPLHALDELADEDGSCKKQKVQGGSTTKPTHLQQMVRTVCCRASISTERRHVCVVPTSPLVVQ